MSGAEASGDGHPDCPECETDVFVDRGSSRYAFKCQFCGSEFGREWTTNKYAAVRQYPEFRHDVIDAVEQHLDHVDADRTRVKASRLARDYLDRDSARPVGHVLALLAEGEIDARVTAARAGGGGSAILWEVARR
jgi:transcription elongation factor Elf1